MSELLGRLRGLKIDRTEKVDENTQRIIFSDDFTFNFTDRVPAGCTVERVPESDEFMRLADKARLTSGCFKQQTGAIIVVNGQVAAMGANEGELKTWCERDKQGFGTGEGYHLCKEICKQFNHAERSAVERVLAAGKDVRGGKLYLSGHWWACALCWRWLMEVGITTVVLDEKAAEKFTKPVSLFS